jgi:hypothetical protein
MDGRRWWGWSGLWATLTYATSARRGQLTSFGLRGAGGRPGTKLDGVTEVRHSRLGV